MAPLLLPSSLTFLKRFSSSTVPKKVPRFTSLFFNPFGTLFTCRGYEENLMDSIILDNHVELCEQQWKSALADNKGHGGFMEEYLLAEAEKLRTEAAELKDTIDRLRFGGGFHLERASYDDALTEHRVRRARFRNDNYMELFEAHFNRKPMHSDRRPSDGPIDWELRCSETAASLMRIKSAGVKLVSIVKFLPLRYPYMIPTGLFDAHIDILDAYNLLSVCERLNVEPRKSLLVGAQPAIPFRDCGEYDLGKADAQTVLEMENTVMRAAEEAGFHVRVWVKDFRSFNDIAIYMGI